MYLVSIRCGLECFDIFNTRFVLGNVYTARITIWLRCLSIVIIRGRQRGAYLVSNRNRL
jgi:hypothetical protein